MSQHPGKVCSIRILQVWIDLVLFTDRAWSLSLSSLSSMTRRRNANHASAPTITLRKLQAMASEQSLRRRATERPPIPSPYERGAYINHVEINVAQPRSSANMNGTGPIGNGRLNIPKAIAVAGAVAQTTLPAWFQTFVMVSLIFGGCCSNVRLHESQVHPVAYPDLQVFALESIVKAEPDAGLLITITQFLLVALTGYYTHFDRSRPPFFLKPNAVPLTRWMVNLLLFFAVNVLNNYAFGFNISVPVHIILRSGGSVTTMVIGWMWGKRFTRVHVLSVAFLTFGVVVAATADARAKVSLLSVTRDHR